MKMTVTTKNINEQLKLQKLRTKSRIQSFFFVWVENESKTVLRTNEVARVNPKRLATLLTQNTRLKTQSINFIHLIPQSSPISKILFEALEQNKDEIFQIKTHDVFMSFASLIIRTSILPFNTGFDTANTN